MLALNFIDYSDVISGYIDYSDYTLLPNIDGIDLSGVHFTIQCFIMLLALFITTIKK